MIRLEKAHAEKNLQLFWNAWSASWGIYNFYSKKFPHKMDHGNALQSLSNAHPVNTRMRGDNCKCIVGKIENQTARKKTKVIVHQKRNAIY